MVVLERGLAVLLAARQAGRIVLNDLRVAGGLDVFAEHVDEEPVVCIVKCAS